MRLLSAVAASNTAAKVLVANAPLSGADMRRLVAATADTNAEGLKLMHPAKAVAAARANGRKQSLNATTVEKRFLNSGSPMTQGSSFTQWVRKVLAMESRPHTRSPVRSTMSNGYNFTERVRKVLAMSREESHALSHEYVGTEHILLGLLKEGEGVASAVLQTLNLDTDGVRSSVLLHVKKGTASPNAGPDLPYTSRAKKVLELSMAEARDLGHSYVGTEHLLLGLLREEKGIAAQVLTDRGLSLSRAREETVRLLGSATEPANAPRSTENTFDRGETRSFKRVTAVFVDFQYEDGTIVRKEFANPAWAIRYLENM